MTDVQDITEDEAINNLPFLLSMTERNRTVWRIACKNGSTALLSPVIQSGPPVDEEVMSVAEEFREQFLEQVDKEV
jgi:hypothetical protein